MSSALRLLASSALLSLGAITAAWPIKTLDYSEDGALCDTSTEQYLQVETYDYHDHPKVTMTWTQTTGECGAAVSNPVSWTATYDSNDGDDPPEDDGRVQLNLFVCCPFGDYELELVVDSYSDDGSTLQQRTAWEIENGPDEYHIWDTVNTYLADVEEYSPTVPGTYVWPLADATGYYSTLYAGPLPPLECEDSVPAGTEYMGCYADSSSSRTFTQDVYKLQEMGEDGMTPEICSSYCSEYDYFGTEFGFECFCGSADEFASATTSTNCGTTFNSLCTGDSTIACGGHSALSVYGRMVTAPTPAPTPAPVSTPSSYTYEGCFVDSKQNRIMSSKTSADPMSAEICFNLCNDGVNNYFGTQFSNECWCGVDSDLIANGEEADDSECAMECDGTAGEMCGDRDRLSAYKMSTSIVGDYVGCYGDASNSRAMPDAGKDILATMTNEYCWERCSGLGYAYSGTQYGVECWCSDSYDTHGEKSTCTYACGGNPDDICGGFYALSVYAV